MKPKELEILLKKSNVTFEPNVNKINFPFEKLDPNRVPDESPIHYAEKLTNFDQSPYDKEEKNIDCDEEEEEPNFEQNSQKKKLGNLNEKLECFKTKLFGKDPFENHFFKQPINIPNSQPLHGHNLNLSKKRSSSSDYVYNDVMKIINDQLERSKLFNNIDYLKQQDTVETSESKMIKKFENEPSNFQNEFSSRNIYENDAENYQIQTPYEISPVTFSPQFFDPISYQVFDITQFIPKIFVVRSDGKIYSLKLKYPQKRSEKISRNSNKIKNFDLKKEKRELKNHQNRKIKLLPQLNENNNDDVKIYEQFNTQKFTQENTKRKRHINKNRPSYGGYN